MIKRTAEEVVMRCAAGFPAVCITGPRQSGKTTLVKKMFPHLPYVLFEEPDVLAQAQNDTRAFLEKYRKSGAIFDEVQHIPQLFSYLQGVIDDDRRIMGRFIITGSQHFAISRRISQSLAGRVGMISLLPLSLEELGEQKSKTVYETLLDGGYPDIITGTVDRSLFFKSYLNTYVERDARELTNIPDLSLFIRFMGLCADRIGDSLNEQSIANALKVTRDMVLDWFHILEASYILFRVPPYHRNFSQQLTSESKLYFYDTGLACHLLNMNSAEQLALSDAKGHLFENLVALEIAKARENRGQALSLAFWRDSQKNEWDFISEWGGNIKCIEAKIASKFNSRFTKNSRFFEKLTTEYQFKNYVIYTGADVEVHDGVKLVPYTKVALLLDE